MSKPGTMHPDSASPLSEQVAHWWAILHGEDCTQSDRRDFAAWVSQSPDRVEAYIRMVSAMSALTRRDVPWPSTSVDELVRMARENRNVEPLAAHGERPAAHGKPRPMTPWLSGIAALLVVALTAMFLAHGPQRYRTGVGEQLSVRLGDGSVLRLNTTSEVEVSFDAELRLVKLTSGEALFQVAHDPTRPFDVLAGQTQIRAVGTEFNVNRRDTRTTITVLEGRVAVSRPPVNQRVAEGEVPASDPAAPILLAGADRLVLSDSGPPSLGQVKDLSVVTAWTERRLVFENRPLAEVAEEFNRYNLDKIRIEDGDLSRQHVSGVFQADDPESFLAFIADIPGVTIRQGDGVHAVARKKVATEGGQTD